MRFHSLASTLLVAGVLSSTLAVAAPGPVLQLDADRGVDLQAFLDSGGRCGTDPSPAFVPMPSGKERFTSLESVIEIPIAFHVIYKESYKNGKKVLTGNVPDSQLDAQIGVLNAAYAGAGILFTKRSVDRRLNNTWFKMTMGSSVEATAKQALAIDPPHVLNIYTAGLGNSLLGWAYFPWAYPDTNTLHGVVLLYSSLPGGSAKPYDLGHTATHEIGHYLGLLHTFQNACRSPGDYVSDTPDEATPAYGCPAGRNTCLTPGFDPITNFMDYTDDACMTNFTPGQIERMRWAIQSYRRGLPTTATARAAARIAPSPLHMENASPNPFNPTTRLAFQLDAAAHVSLDILDVAGRRVARVLEADLGAGPHEAIFEGRNLASGVYMAVLTSGRNQATQRLVLMK